MPYSSQRITAGMTMGTVGVGTAQRRTKAQTVREPLLVAQTQKPTMNTGDLSVHAGRQQFARTRHTGLTPTSEERMRADSACCYNDASASLAHLSDSSLFLSSILLPLSTASGAFYGTSTTSHQYSPTRSPLHFMHGPRRSRTLSRRTGGATPTKPSSHSAATAASAPPPLRPPQSPTTAAATSSTASTLLSPRDTQRRTATATAFPKDCPHDTGSSRQLSPRAMWRAPAPRPVPLPALLTALPSTPRLPRLGDASVSTSSTPTTAQSPPRSRRPHEAEGAAKPTASPHRHSEAPPSSARETGSYGDGYERLIFTTTPLENECGAATEAATSTVLTPPQLPQAFPPTATALAQSSPPSQLGAVLPSLPPGSIFDVQASAAIDHLPAGPAKAEMQRTAHKPSSSLADAESGSLGQQNLEGTLARAGTGMPDAWWSTLDGTASLNELLEHYPPGSLAGTLTQQPQQQQSLNDTLGRADRAAMVLSMSYPSPERGTAASTSTSATHGADASLATNTAPVGLGNVNLGVAQNHNSAAGVAATAARFSLATAGLLGQSHHTMLSETLTMPVVHENTLQELRDTLQLTQPQLFVSNGAFPGLPTQPMLSQSLLADRIGPPLATAAAAPSVMEHSRRFNKPQNASKAHHGAVVPGTQRTRAAIARLYAATPTVGSAISTAINNARAPSSAPSAADTEVAPAPPSWQQEALTMAALTRRAGPFQATHAIAHGPGHHTATANKPLSRRSTISPAAASSTAAASAAPAPTSAAEGSASSSVPSADFSTASLSSSIFNRELGAGEAARTAAHAAVSSHASAKRPHKLKPVNGVIAAQPVAPQQHNQQETDRAATAYLREQQRLYASHLATPSSVLAQAGIGEPATSNALEDLFADTVMTVHREAIHDVGMMTIGTGTLPNTLRGVVSLKLTDAVSTALHELGMTTASSSASPQLHLAAEAAPSRDALRDAMAARQSLLRRHVQESPAWERLLHKVRQWSDRTHIMVRFDNGECVEQLAGVPPHRGHARQQRVRSPQQASPQSGANEPSNDTRRRTTREGGGDDSQVNATATLEGSKSDDGWERYEYIDDPALAHDAVMQRVAQEMQDVQRLNALEMGRRRQMQREATMNSSTLMVLPGVKSVREEEALSHSTLNGSLTRDFPRLGSRKGTGSGATWARSAFPTDDILSSTPRQPPWESAAVWDTSTSSPDAEAHLSASAAQSMSRSLGRGMVPLANEHEGRPTPARLLGSKPFYLNKTAEGEVVSPHAALCAKLQTWGTPPGDEDGEEQDRRLEEMGRANSAAEAPPAWLAEVELPLRHVEEANETEAVGTVVRWDSDMADVAETERSAAHARKRPQKSQNAFRAASSVARSAKAAPSAVASQQSKVSLDVLAFVLTCATSGTVDGAGGDGLGSLAYASSQRRSGEQGDQERDGVDDDVDAYADTPAAAACLQAARTILRDGFGLASTAAHHGTRRQEDEADARRSQAVQPVHWGELLTSLLEGYNVFNLRLLKHLHRLLRQFALWQATTISAKAGVRRKTEVTIVQDGSGEEDLGPHTPLVWPLVLFVSSPPTTASSPSHISAGSRSKTAASPSPSPPPPSESAVHSSIMVDAADLLNALTSTPELLQWLLHAHQSSPSRSWSELLEALPAVRLREWQALLARSAERAVEEAAASVANGPSTAPPARRSWDGLAPSAAPSSRHPSPQLRRVSSPHSSALRSPSPRLSDGSGGEELWPSMNVTAFACDVKGTLTSSRWRLRVLRDIVTRACAAFEAARSADKAPPSLALCTSASSSAPPHAVLFPCVGSTPYLPDEESRRHYPLDMRHLYLISALAGEDVELRVAPQLREVRKQYAEAQRSAQLYVIGSTAIASGAAETAADGAFAHNGGVAAVSSSYAPPASASAASALPAPPAKAAASLPLALQQRVQLHRLFTLEARFFSLLASLWSQEHTIVSFNQHVKPFNEFVAAEQQRWGPVYRSSLTVAFFVCEELAEKKMEKLPPELLPFVSVVATFLGCRNGYRELAGKLPEAMLDLVERAKKVQVPLESLSWQGKRQQVLQEAVQASQIAPRRAGAVVTCLATESDATAVPLAELPLPALQLKDVPPLPPLER